MMRARRGSAQFHCAFSTIGECLGIALWNCAFLSPTERLLTPQRLKRHYGLGKEVEFCTARGGLVSRSAMICLAQTPLKPTAKRQLNIAQHYAFFPFQSSRLVQHSQCDGYVSRAEQHAFSVQKV
jgi:hypothetical protein